MDWLYVLAVLACCAIFAGAVFLIVILVAYAVSQTARYYIKFSIFACSTLFSVVASLPLILPLPFTSWNALIPSFALRHLSRYLLGISWSIHGLDNMVKDTGAVMVINHQSALDLLVLAEIWPVVGQCTVVVKKSVFYYWPFGLGSYLWGTLFIDRSDRKASQESVNKTAKALKEKKAKLCIFPEGTRHCGPELLPFKKGAFHVAITNQCPIQPVVVSRYYWLDAEKKKFDSGHNLITFLPAISTEGLELKDMDDLIKRTRDIMSAAYKETSAKSLRLRSRKAQLED